MTELKNITENVDCREDRRSVVKRLVSSFVRKWRFLFMKRLAIKPGVIDRRFHEKPGADIYIFEWQSMPKGYRWF